jgi:hypothetical protein
VLVAGEAAVEAGLHGVEVGQRVGDGIRGNVNSKNILTKVVKKWNSVKT